MLSGAAPRLERDVRSGGGPEPLSSSEVAAIFQALVDRPLRVSAAPAAVFRVLDLLLTPWSEAAGNIMAINYLSATQDDVVAGAVETATQSGIQLTTAEEFLRSKLRETEPA